MILEALAVGIFSLLLLTFWRQDPPPLHGIYAQPGRWYHWKRWLLYALLSWRRNRNNSLIHTGCREARKDGYALMQKLRRIDESRPLLQQTQAHDSLYFNGVNSEGVYLVLRISRRHDRRAELWITLRIPDVGVFESAVHPDTMVYNTDGTGFSAAGLRFECLEPFRRWRISYSGLLRKGLREEWSNDPGVLEHVRYSFCWEAFTDTFDFKTDNDPWLMSGSLALGGPTDKYNLPKLLVLTFPIPEQPYKYLQYPLEFLTNPAVAGAGPATAGFPRTSEKK